MAELGQTGDPRQLIPGDPAAIEANIVAIRGRGEAMEDAANGLKRIDSGAWVGTAGEAFRDQFSYEPSRWYQASDAFGTTAKALSSYAETLRWAQGQAGEAIRLWDDGQAATQNAQDAHQRAVADAEARTRAGLPTVVPTFSDPGESTRQAARDTLNRARQQLTEAGDRAMSTIWAAGDQAPEQSGWDAFWDGVGDVAGFIGDVGLGLWDGVTGTVEFLWDISPHHLITDPAHYAEVWTGLTSAASFAVDHPLEFGKQMINWDQWSKEPGRALGNAAFGFIPVAGVVAKARKLRKVVRAAPDAPNVRPTSPSGPSQRPANWMPGRTPKAGPRLRRKTGRQSTSTIMAWSGLRSRKAAPAPRVVVTRTSRSATSTGNEPIRSATPSAARAPTTTPIDWDW